MSSGPSESDADFDARYEAFFNRKDIDGWDIRKAFGDLGRMGMVPEPVIVAAALRACRLVHIIFLVPFLGSYWGKIISWL